MESQKTFMGSEVNYINICTLRQTRLHSVDAQLSVESWHSKGDMSTLTWRLHNDLSREVFDESTNVVMENCRAIWNSKSLLVRIYQKGSVIVELEEPKTFSNAVRSITGSVTTVDDSYLIIHYGMLWLT